MRAVVAAPTPLIFDTGSFATNALPSAAPMTENPRGFCNSDASFARNLLGASPIETVMPTSRSTRAAMMLRASAAGDASVRQLSVRSRYASSIETGSKTEVAPRKIARISLLTRLYLAMSGGITTASGQASNALNIGIAERTPKRRAI